MKKILGILLMIFGALGGFIPVLPGFLFFFAGLALLSPKLEAKFKEIYNNYQNHRSLKKAFKELIFALTPSWLKKNNKTNYS